MADLLLPLCQGAEGRGAVHRDDGLHPAARLGRREAGRARLDDADHRGRAGELVDDAWIVLDAAESDLLHPEPAELWWTVVGRQGGDIRLLANYPSEPWVN